MTTLEAKTANYSFYVKIEIVSVTIGFARTLENGEWVNTTKEPQRFEDNVLTLGKTFANITEAEKFMKTRQFKSFFKNVEKNLV